MISDIETAYRQLRQAVVDFNQVWPEYVAAGTVWRIPLLTEQKTPDAIVVERLDGTLAIEAAKQALLEFERDIGQAAGTVMRLPGIFFLRTGVLDHVVRINMLKDLVKDAIEQTRIELNQVPAARPRIMRRALGGKFSSNQLYRHIQAFDGAPRLVIFTWAGHTSGSEYKAVGHVRDQLLQLAEARAEREGISLEETAEYIELKSLSQMADDESLVKRKLVAPHPRAMFYFTESTRYEAMIHANLPAFVLVGDSDCELRGLKNFNRAERSALRPDRKESIAAVPGKDLYLPRKSKQANAERRDLTVPTTYGHKEK